MRTIGLALAILGVLTIPSRAAADCGDGLIDGDETCDLGIGNGRAECTQICASPRCGDGLQSPGETCDDGNAIDGDGCSATCVDEAAPRNATTIDNGAYDESITSLAVLGDGSVGLLESAHIWNFPETQVVAFDAFGEPRWTASLGESPYDAILHELITLEDSEEVVVVGRRTAADGSTRGWLQRYDRDGRLLLSTAVGDGHVRSIHSIERGPNGDVWVGGTRENNGEPDPWVARIDPSSGLARWSTTVAQPGFSNEITGLAWDRGDLYAVGNIGTRHLVARFGADEGDVLWVQTALSADDLPSSLSDVAIGSDGGVYVVGVVNLGWDETLDGNPTYDGWIARFEPDGTQSWSANENSVVGGNDWLSAVEVLQDGSIITAGTVQTQPLLVPQNWDQDASLARWSPDGQRLRRIDIDGELHHEDNAYALAQRDDGTLLVAGHTHTKFEGRDGWVFELDPLVAEPSALVGTSQIGSFVRGADRGGDVASSVRSEDPPARVGSIREEILYINFFGGELTPGTHGPSGQVPCIDTPITYPAQPVDEVFAEGIAERVRAGLAPYNVRVVWEERPPAHLPYTTVMVGARAEQLGLGEGTAGYACEVDCGDSQPSQLAFVFGALSEQAAATAIMHEAAHTWGLDHVESSEAVMDPFASTAAESFADQCMDVTESTSAAHCMAEHSEFCPDGQQNAHAELMARFGPSRIDLQPPSLSVEGIEEGLRIEPGTAMTLEAFAEDDSGSVGVELRVPELDVALPWQDLSEPLDVHLPPGVFTIVVRAEDPQRNVEEVRVRVWVGEEPGSRDPSSSPEDIPPSEDKEPRAVDNDAGCSIGSRSNANLYGLILFAIICRPRTGPGVRRSSRGRTSSGTAGRRHS